TLEYTTKMLYENTVGRVFSWFANGTPSDQEKTIFAAQRAYSDFIYDKAWYEFQFMPWVTKVWSVSNSAESNWFRKVERMLCFTAEFTFKAAYAKLIEWGAKASYEEPVTTIYLLGSTSDGLTTSQDLRIIHELGDQKIIGITRWGAFTKTVLENADKNIAIQEIGGNDEIVISVIAEAEEHADLMSGQLLYDSRIVSNEKLKRHVYLVPVEKLFDFIKEAHTRSMKVEHVFDY
ncbi:MAG TPA: hypothetical protein VGD31_02755, partial [Sphingobacteriaceae bacterium]